MGSLWSEFPAMLDCVSMMFLFVDCVNRNKCLNSCFINGSISVYHHLCYLNPYGCCLSHHCWRLNEHVCRHLKKCWWLNHRAPIHLPTSERGEAKAAWTFGKLLQVLLQQLPQRRAAQRGWKFHELTLCSGNCPFSSTGWWLSHPSEEWWSEFVSWDDFPFRNEWKVSHNHIIHSMVPNHQPDSQYYSIKLWFIFDLPSYKMVILHSYVTVYQRFNDLSRMMMSIDVRFPEGKHPNINKSTMTSRFPKWEAVISNISLG